MKRSVSVAILFTLVFSACIPGFAQKVRVSNEIVRPVKTSYARVAALTDGNGVLVQWDMTAENRNVGFWVDRVGASDAEPVSATMILGGEASSSDDIVYGGRYQIFDPQGTADSQYVVRSVGRDGGEVVSKVAGVTTVKDLEVSTGTSSAGWLETRNPANKNLTTGDLDLHPELRQLVDESIQAPDLPNHRWVVSQPGVKIAVRREGMYRVTVGELSAAGFNTETDSSTWRLFMEGNEQAIIVGPSGGYIEFYGKPIDTRDSDTRFYYLINGEVAGLRMENRVLRSIGGPAFSTSYSATTFRKERDTFVPDILNGAPENYFGRVISTSPDTYSFPLTGVETTGEVTLTVKLQGWTGTEHSVRMVLNGQEIPAMTWTGNQTSFTRSYLLPASALREGANNLQMTGLNAGRFDLFDSISVTHKRRYLAEQNKIGFFTPGLRKVDVTGFTAQNVRVFDMTLDGNPKLLVNLPVVADGSGFKVTLPSSRNFVGYATDDSALLASPSVTANNPSSYSASTTPYELLIISHGSPDFMFASESWANYRRSQGFTAKVIDVSDIYDEFGYGTAGSAPIKAFLNYAYDNWTFDPKYVMFMGDASVDPRNYEGFGNWDFIPSQYVDLEFEESAGDEALGDFDGDGIAEFAIGRIPARDVATINTLYGKTVSFETLPNQSLDRGALFAYDFPNGWDFNLVSQQLADQLPPTMPRVFIGRESPTANADLISEMSSGQYIVNYSGHGSLALWASETFFGPLSIPSVTNVNNPSFFTMLGCLNGYFIKPGPNFDSISELLLKSNTGGAAATWASTAKTFPDVQTIMAIRFYDQFGEGNITRAGDLIKDAKSAIPNGSVRYSWVLLGDPMLKLR